jgi:hypothetical protein
MALHGYPANIPSRTLPQECKRCCCSIRDHSRSTDTLQVIESWVILCCTAIVSVIYIHNVGENNVKTREYLGDLTDDLSLAQNPTPKILDRLAKKDYAFCLLPLDGKTYAEV